MASINTEEAARRLARVILSDIELYNRERPKLGETLEAQIEEGRRLFASRVTPELIPVFALVLSDRERGGVKSPAAAEPPPTPAPSIAAQSLEDQPPPGPAQSLEDQPPPGPAQSLEDQPTPGPVLAAPPLVDQPARAAKAPTKPLAPAIPLAPAQARPAAPPAHEIPVPVLTARLSIPRLLAIVSAVAATVAVLFHLLS